MTQQKRLLRNFTFLSAALSNQLAELPIQVTGGISKLSGDKIWHSLPQLVGVVLVNYNVTKLVGVKNPEKNADFFVLMC